CLGRQPARSSAKEIRPEARTFSGRPEAKRLRRRVQRRKQSGGHFGRGCGLDLRRRNRRAERADDCVNAWLAWPYFAVPRCERLRTLDHRNDADGKRTV